MMIRAALLIGLVLMAGCASLHGPARRGEWSVVAERVAGGADVEARDEAGNTPLHLAALHGRQSVVEVLLAAGADAGARNALGATPLHYWAMGRHTTTDVATRLLAAGAHVGARAQGGATPLHWAAARGMRRRANGASRSSGVMDDLERTARIPVVGAGAAVAAAPVAGLIALLEAFTSDPEPVENITVLVNGGADVKARDGRGNTPLHRAAQADAPADRVTALLSAGADGGARNAVGAMAVDLVPDDSALWSVLVPFRTAGSSGGAVPGAVRNLRVTRLTETPRPEWDDYREWTWTWTWDRPASDGGHPITEYGYDSAPCGRRVSRNANAFRMTRARSGERSFTHVDEFSGLDRPTTEEHEVERVASLWAVNAMGAGACVEVSVVER